MNLFADLKRDHRALLDLLFRAGRTSARCRAARSVLLEKAHTAFETCASLEEGNLLPALRSEPSASDAPRLVETTAELVVARRMFEDLRDLEPGDPLWIERLNLLTQHVQRRIAQDQSELFPLAKRIMGGPGHSSGSMRANRPRTARGRVASLWV
jgi:hypothetical protein